MTKLLSLLSLTTALSTASVLPLVQENNNQTISISINNQINSNEISIDNINEKMSITAKVGTDEIIDISLPYRKILSLSWEEAKTITTGIASNYFAHFLSTRTVTLDELQLEKQITEPTRILLAGYSSQIEINKQNQIIQDSNIYVSIVLEKLENNPELTQAWIQVISKAQTLNSDKICKTEYFLNKITLNK